MSPDRATDDGGDTIPGTRATVRTTHASPTVVARAVRPDNTPEIDTRVVDGAIETTIERDTASGLRSTVDDYVVNITVADRVARLGAGHADGVARLGAGHPDRGADTRTNAERHRRHNNE